MAYNFEQWSARWSIPETFPRSEVSKLVWKLCSDLSHEFGCPVRYRELFRPRITGTYLLEQMGTDLTPLPADIQHLITGTSCQHRIEFFRRSGTLPGITYYDGRFMYAGCCSGLGVAGESFRHVKGEDIRPEERGRALVRFTAPDNWPHVGLLAIKREDGEGWAWPAEGGGETWADLCEIRFARQQGWAVEVAEKLTWPEARPLDKWADRLSRLYLRAKGQKNDVLAACYRDICLHAIGGFHNIGYKDHRETVARDDPRATFEAVEAIDEEGAHIRERVRFDKPEQHIHPEWSAAIWSRVHLRIAKALLAVPKETILAINGDAIYLTRPAEFTTGNHPDNLAAWKDDGKPGRLRIKGQVEGPVPAPRNWMELRGLCDG